MHTATHLKTTVAILIALIGTAQAQVSYQTYGGFTFGSDGSWYGNYTPLYQPFTFGSDGSLTQRYGNVTIYTPIYQPYQQSQPPVVCQTYGNMTFCN